MEKEEIEPQRRQDAMEGIAQQLMTNLLEHAEVVFS
jgi:hypothetical protein